MYRKMTTPNFLSETNKLYMRKILMDKLPTSSLKTKLLTSLYKYMLTFNPGGIKLEGWNEIKRLNKELLTDRIEYYYNHDHEHEHEHEHYHEQNNYEKNIHDYVNPLGLNLNKKSDLTDDLNNKLKNTYYQSISNQPTSIMQHIGRRYYSNDLEDVI